MFVGSRVPFRALVDYLEDSLTLDCFLDDFPTVTRAQAVAALEQANDLMVAGARPAG